VSDLRPILADWRPLREALAQPSTLRLEAGASPRLAVILEPHELATARSGRITLGVEVIGPAGSPPPVAAILGAVASGTLRDGARSVYLWTLNEPGIRFLDLMGVQAAGSYRLEVYLAGDVNGDAALDGRDAVAFDAALGSVTGQPAYRIGADANRDGQVTDADRRPLDLGAGFVANRAPTIAAIHANSYRDLPVAIPLGAAASDPESQPLRFIVTAAQHGTVSPVGDGRTVQFYPEPGFTGIASFTVQADDGRLTSAPAEVRIAVVEAALVRLQLDERDLAMTAGTTRTIGVLGEFADGQTRALPGRMVQFTSTDPAHAVVSPTGLVWALSDGIAVIEAHRDTLTTVTPVTIGERGAPRTLKFYPSSVTLEPNGATRQFLVRELLGDGAAVVDRSAPAAGTRYYVGNSTVATIDPTGLLTTRAAGRTDVTIVHQGQSVVAHVTVAPAVLNSGIIGTQGGVVGTPDGIAIAIAQGALDGDAVVEVIPRTEADMPYAAPGGFTFAGAFEVRLGGATLEHGLGVTLPAPAGAKPGDPIYLFRPGRLLVGPGQYREMWELVDRLVVEADGQTARTTSPPYPSYSLEGVAFGFSPSLLSLAFATASMSLRIGAIEVDPETGTPFYSVPGLLADLWLPVPKPEASKLRVYRVQPDGSVSRQELTTPPINPGDTLDLGAVAPALPPGTEWDWVPIIEEIKIAKTPATPGAGAGPAYVRTDLGNSLTVIDPALILESSGIVARIPVGLGPTDVAVTPDGRYAFVTNTGEGTISVVNTLTLEEVDLNPSAPGIQRIVTGPGTQPFHIAIHPTAPYGFATDRSSPQLTYYQFSTNLNDYLEPAKTFGAVYTPSAIASSLDLFGAFGFTGLNDVDFSADGRLAFFTSPGRAGLYGADELLPDGYLFISSLDAGVDGTLLAVGPRPWGLAHVPNAQSQVEGVAVRANEGAGLLLVNTNILTPPSGRASVTASVRSYRTNLRGYEAVDLLPKAGGNIFEILRYEMKGGPEADAAWVWKSVGGKLERQRFLVKQPYSLFDINSAEALAFSRDGQFAYVLFNNTFSATVKDVSWLGKNQSFAAQDRDPNMNAGGNIGVIVRPLDRPSDAGSPGVTWFAAATRQAPYSWPDEIVVDPYNLYLFASYKGNHAVFVYDKNRLDAAATILGWFDKDAIRRSTRPIEDYIVLMANAGSFSAFANQIGFQVDPTLNLGRAEEQFKSFLDTIGPQDTWYDETFDVGGHTHVRKNPILVRKIGSGKLPSGVATGPEAPPDIFARDVYYHDGEGKDSLRLNYVISGQAPDYVRLGIYEEGLGGLNPTPVFTLVLTEAQRSAGFHSIPLELGTALNPSDDTRYLVRLDDTNAVAEVDEDNNEIAMHIRPGDFVADFDGSDDEAVFGAYIQGVRLVNTFHLRPHSAVAKTLAEMWVHLIPSDNAQATSMFLQQQGDEWIFNLDMANVPDRSKLVVYLAWEGGSSTREYTLRTIDPPRWIDAREPHADRVNIQVKWDAKSKTYYLARFDHLIKLDPIFGGAGLFLFHDLPVGVSYGSFISFKFDLKGKTSQLWYGPTIGFILFGNYLDQIIPIQWLPAFSYSPDTLGELIQAHNDDKTEGLGKFLDEKFTDATGSDRQLSSKYLLGHFKDASTPEPTPPSDKAPSPWGRMPNLATQFAFEKSAEFQIDDQLRLNEGAGFAISFGFTWTWDWSFEWMWSVPGPAAVLAQIVTGVKAEFAIGVTPKLGMETVKVGDSVDLDSKGSLATGFTVGVTGFLRPQVLYGVASIEASLGLSLEIPLPTVFWYSEMDKSDPRLEWKPPAMKATSSAALDLFFGLYKQPIPWADLTIFQTDNFWDHNRYQFLLYNWQTGMLELQPKELPPLQWPIALAGPAAAPGNPAEAAVNIGPVNGSARQTDLTLVNDRDPHVFKFRTLDTARGADAVTLSFDQPNAPLRASLFDKSGQLVGRLEPVDARRARVPLEGLPAGEYVLVVGTPQTDPLPYQLDIAAPATGQAALYADLAVPAYFVPTGSSLSLPLAIHNAGTLPAPASQARLLWSRDSLIDGNDANLGPIIEVPALAPGAAWTQTVNVTLPATELGPLYLGLVADRRNQVAEASKVDNHDLEAVYLTLPPDALELEGLPAGRYLLSVSSPDGLPFLYDLTVSSAVRTGANLVLASVVPPRALPAGSQDYRATVLLRNTGNQATRDFNVQIELDVDTTHPIVGVLPVAYLAAGQTLALDVPLTVPTVPADRNLGQDPAAAVSYRLLIAAPDVPGPNLVVRSVSVITTDLAPGRPLELEALLANFGTAPTAATTAQYLLSPDPNFDLATDTILGPRFNLDPLEPGQSIADRRSLTLPANASPGWLYVGLILDPDQAVAESAETDNSGLAPILIPPSLAGASNVAVAPEPVPLKAPAPVLQLGPAPMPVRKPALPPAADFPVGPSSSSEVRSSLTVETVEPVETRPGVPASTPATPTPREPTLPRLGEPPSRPTTRAPLTTRLLTPPSALLNGHFDLADPSDPAFGWLLADNASVIEGAGHLAEGTGLLSRLSQSFLLPAQVSALQFTLKSVQLATNPRNPPDAFEVALRDAQSGQSLLGTIEGLTLTDALLNLQADGRVYYGRGVLIQPLLASGDVRPDGVPLVVTIDLTGLALARRVLLEFDLIGFGPANSQVVIDDVQILTGPPVAFALDAASDSGLAGDDLTNRDRVALVGTTLPNLTVQLDLDGDGFDDGQALADDAGQFRFDQVALREGPNLLRVQASNALGNTIVERRILLDQTAPRVLSHTLNDGASQRSMLTSIALAFSEDIAGSIAAADLVLRNLTTDQIVAAERLVLTPLTPSQLRLTFTDLTGNSLPDGNYLATLLAAGITDAAGNSLDGDGNGTGGDDYRFTFFRYYGDLDGDRDVDHLDLYGFQQTYRKTAADPTYNAALDFDADGAIGPADLAAYQLRYLSRLPAVP